MICHTYESAIKHLKKFKEKETKLVSTDGGFAVKNKIKAKVFQKEGIIYSIINNNNLNRTIVIDRDLRNINDRRIESLCEVNFDYYTTNNDQFFKKFEKRQSWLVIPWSTFESLRCLFGDRIFKSLLES